MDFLIWLNDTALGTAVRESLWLYPIFEIIHLIGIALLVGAIVMTDMRLLGLSRKLPVNLTAQHLLPWVWAGFALALISGFALFSSFTTGYWANPAFRIKLILILAAGVNASLFHFRVYRGVIGWNQDVPTPVVAKVFAGISIALWFSIIAAGRLIAYTGSGAE